MGKSEMHQSVWKLVIVLLALSGCATASSETDEALPIKASLPSECQMQSVRPGGWVCNYIASNGRNRRLLLDFQRIELDEKGKETLSRLDPETLKLVLDNEIRKIDERREAEMPSSGYARLQYEFLGAVSLPSGFDACAISRDEVVFESSEIGNDRASLHCWAAERVHGVMYQMLLSLIEYRDATQGATPALDEEFDRIVSTIVRDPI